MSKSKIKFPDYCDFSCKYADFTEPSSSGACRKESAIWCKHFKKYNNKHNKCFGSVIRKEKKYKDYC